LLGGAVGAVALGRLGADDAAAKEEKVTICHKPGTPAEQTKEVPASALKDHFGHGTRPAPVAAPSSGSAAHATRSAALPARSAGTGCAA
jgi:hypothetical protein